MCRRDLEKLLKGEGLLNVPPWPRSRDHADWHGEDSEEEEEEECPDHCTTNEHAARLYGEQLEIDGGAAFRLIVRRHNALRHDNSETLLCAPADFRTFTKAEKTEFYRLMVRNFRDAAHPAYPHELVCSSPAGDDPLMAQHSSQV